MRPPLLFYRRIIMSNIVCQCDTCVCKEVCKYENDYRNTTINSKHPNLKITLNCSYYKSTTKMSINDQRIMEWYEKNPNGTTINCAKALGLTRQTVSKCINKYYKN